MIQILVNGIYLDISADTVFTFVQDSPLFTYNQIPGPYTYPASIPATSNNKNAFQFITNPQNSEPLNKTVDCKVFFNGIEYLKKALLRVVQVYDDYFEISIYSGASYIGNKIKDMSLRSFDLGGDVTIPNAHVYSNAISTYFGDFLGDQYPDRNCALPMIFNENMWRKAGVSKPSGDEALFINFHYHQPASSNGYYFANGLTPMPFAVYVIKQIFKNCGFEISGDFVEDDEIRQLLIYSNYSLLRGPYNASAALSYAESYNLANHVPDITAAKFLTAIRKGFNVGFFVDVLKDTVTIKSAKEIMADPTAVDYTHKAGRELQQYPFEYNGFKFSFSFDDEDELSGDNDDDLQPYEDTYTTNYPSSSATSLDRGLLAYAKLNNKVFEVQQTNYYVSKSWEFLRKYATSNALNEIENVTLKADVADLATLKALSSPDTNDVRFVTKLNQYWIYRLLPDGESSWDFFSENFYDKTVDGGGDDIKADFAPLAMVYIDEDEDITAWSDVNGIMPRVKQLMNSQYYNVKVVEPSLRFIFNRGLSLNISGNKYPFASTGVYDSAGTKSWNYALTWETDEGLYNVWWSAFVNAIKNSRVLLHKMNFSLYEILTFDLSKKVNIGHIKGLPMRLKYSIGMQGVVDCELEMVKL